LRLKALSFAETGFSIGFDRDQWITVTGEGQVIDPRKAC